MQQVMDKQCTICEVFKNWHSLLEINHKDENAMWISFHREWGKWARENSHIQAYISSIQHRTLVCGIFISNDLNHINLESLRLKLSTK